MSMTDDVRWSLDQLAAQTGRVLAGAAGPNSQLRSYALFVREELTALEAALRALHASTEGALHRLQRAVCSSGKVTGDDLCTLAEAHRSDSEWMDEHHEDGRTLQATELALRQVVERWKPQAVCHCTVHCDCEAHAYEVCIADIEALLALPLGGERKT